MRLAILILFLGACDARPSPSPVDAAPPPIPTSSATAQRDPEAAALSYLVRYTGGATADETLPMVVAIHGLGDRPERFGLLDGFEGKARVILPRGPKPHPSGYSWFDIVVRGQRDVSAVASGTRAAAAELAGMIQTLRERHPTKGKAIVTGFSQGGMLSFALAVLHPEQVALAVPVAGWLPESLVPSQAPEGAPPIVALHGVDDGILALAPTQQSVSQLRQSGFAAQLIEYPGVAHGVSGQMRRELFRRLAEATSSE